MDGQTSTVTHPDPESEVLNPATAARELVDDLANVLTKPRFRGWIHVYSAVIAVVAGASLIAVSWAVASTRAGLATFAYIAATVVMFTVSATYHRVQWKSATARKWMKRLDHSMIFVFIAGTYTPFAVLALPPAAGRLVLSIVWGGALAGILLKVCWPTAPRWLGVPLYLLLGWVAIGYTVTILHNAGVTAMVLLFVGGAFYSIGGILYALKWPNPWPTTFGFHEFFHACTAIAAICHYIAMWFVVF
jgi:hemolysin III